jgi:hypothetical protein
VKDTTKRTSPDRPDGRSDPSLIGRRSLLVGIGALGAASLASGLVAGCGGSGSDVGSPPSTLDGEILGAAKVAEALATTMYTGIIELSPFFAALPRDDQDYFRAARDEEKYHYDLLKGATGGSDAPLVYFFPTGMFADTATTLTVLVTLEEAFIAAYLLGVRELSAPGLRVLAAQIMGVESDHRTLARLIASEEGLTELTTFGGQPESTAPPNNNVYERTYGVRQIAQVVSALRPFIDRSAAGTAGHTVERTFDPSYVPNFPGLLGNPPD